MLIKDVRGREKNLNFTKYLAKWDGPCRSKFQFNVKQFFKPYWKHLLCFEEFPVVGSRKTIDFLNYSSRIVVESQGEFHTGFSEFAHGGNRAKWLGQITRDREKEDWALLNGFMFMEIYPKDLKVISVEWIKEKFGVDLV